MHKIPRPSAALVVASLALAVALSGTAVAAGVVPLAKRALNADNAKHALVSDTAKKLGPQSSAALVQQAASQAASQAATQAGEIPGPASTAAGLVSVKSVAWSLAAKGEGDFTATCDAGQKVIGGGWEDPEGWGHQWDNRPTPDGTGWKVYVTVSQNAPGQQSGTVYALCLK
jgi:hypothetical protein